MFHMHRSLCYAQANLGVRGYPQKHVDNPVKKAPPQLKERGKFGRCKMKQRVSGGLQEKQKELRMWSKQRSQRRVR